MNARPSACLLLVAVAWAVALADASASNIVPRPPPPSRGSMDPTNKEHGARPSGRVPAASARPPVALKSSSCPSQCVPVKGDLNSKKYKFPVNDVALFRDGVQFLSEINRQLETPIQFHKTTTVAAVLFNLVSAYDPVALDFFGRNDTAFYPCCNSQRKNALRTHRSLAIAYMWLHLGEYLGARAMYRKQVRSYRVPLDLFDTSTDPAQPHGWAKIVSDEFIEYVRTDGWNSEGDLFRTRNRQPYRDTTDYCPRRGDFTRWQPLEDTNGLGAFFEQVHVTPHIGRTGRLFLMNETEFAERKAPPPNYDYGLEIRKLLWRSRALAGNTDEQAKIELFDAKFESLVPLLLQVGLSKPELAMDIQQMAAYILSIDIAAQEAITLVWKEKLRYDLVRPETRLVSDIGSATMVQAFARPDGGLPQTLPAGNWEPYLRTMPHSEYPSASACMCKASIEVGQVYNGGNDLSGILPIVVLKQGASRVQPNFPPRDVFMIYNTTNSIVRDCARTRLTSGLHFTKSTIAGKNLCSGLGARAVEKAKLLLHGDPSGRFGNPDDGLPTVRAAPRRPSGQC